MIVLLLPILQTSVKSVQTTAEVCTDYTCSLHGPRRVLHLGVRKHRNKYDVLTKVFTCTYVGKYDVLTEVFTCKYSHVYACLLYVRIIQNSSFQI